MELCLNSRMTNFSPSFRQMRRLGSGKFSDAEVMGKKLHCFKQTGQQSKKQLTVKMSIFTSDVGTEVKLRDLEMEKRDPRTVVAVILGGGAGTGLFPLTQRRAIPAVPMGGAYRLIDVPMSNCINSGINKVYILTQFNSASLNRHLARAYNFSNGIVDSIVSHGSFLDSCFIEHSVVGIRSRINSNVHLKDTVMLGADYYETDAEVTSMLAEGRVPIGIGENTKIKECIIDKNARIGKNVTITNSDGVQEADRSSESFYIRSGITVILKNSTIPDRFVI